MKFQQLECLVAIADTGSFYGATDKTLFPQQLVIKHIEELEQELGHALIYQEDIHVYLTRQGQQVLRHAREILKRRDDLYAELDANIEY